MENSVEFTVAGRCALFCDPAVKAGGGKCTYQVPTYQAVKGIIESIYWKPTIIWVIDQVRVMHKIVTEAKQVPTKLMADAKTLSFAVPAKDQKLETTVYTYLSDVSYQVKAHFEWNLCRTDLERDRNENKHYFITKRMIERGGRRDIFLGTKDCPGTVKPCVFGEGESYYHNRGQRYSGTLSFGMMFHGFDYPDETGHEELVSRFSPISMDLATGIIVYPKPEACVIREKTREMLLI